MGPYGVRLMIDLYGININFISFVLIEQNIDDTVYLDDKVQHDEEKWVRFNFRIPEE